MLRKPEVAEGVPQKGDWATPHYKRTLRVTNGRCSRFRSVQVAKAKPRGRPVYFVHYDDDIVDVFGQLVSQVVFGQITGEVANVQFGAHKVLLT